ncbi:TetR family transcriptional regulator [Streptomyces acidiscabies]|uniref:TetR family transcriptional regulator n=1 Tax=Streptomyces acidiscabies TaxID=42234 RepID=A0AAP6BDK7_9ACTN|nr:TetR family transcriptional regulator [Streptomyces acidiscabies]MBP5934690.1 TetR family transcriptional regulator [Streptomyces sp. LBUM 1476]MBZ3917589.1 TetR family transcriptional regulator [Streptomyces acidiscabies]MDX2962724.1 TetR family transcriptional regulator [Streptomyces acidiscabies]MDX3018969.1 TetR family transcriptional regulator [Streptomyces acidiscabies]MDX3790359.1 TetR family transcriptional regulator [Streptomyces acidiscabies]
MSRWQPDARGRLAKAALDLYDERGFERTTVAEIAQRAGLTERTFFRHYADKREVLFGGTADLLDRITAAAASVPADALPLDVVVAVLDGTAEDFPEVRRSYARRRQAVIDAHPELRERELIKLADFSAALCAVLRERGVPGREAALGAEAGTAVFKVAFARWIEEDDGPGLGPLMHETMAALRAVTGC